MACPQRKTRDGFELQFGTNYLGTYAFLPLINLHMYVSNYPQVTFFLFHLLKDALTASSSPSFNSRVISLSSAGHRYGTINFDDLNSEHTESNAWAAYSQSKLANAYFSNEVDRRFQPRGVRAFAVHPGGIITPLSRYMPAATTKGMQEDPEISKILSTPAQGASTTVWASVAKELEGKGGLYLDETGEAQLTPADAPSHSGGYGANTFNPEAEKKLWAKSLELLALSDA